MGVFFYSNRRIDASRVVDVFKKRGHHDIVNHEGVDFTLITAPKIIIKNENFLSGKQLGVDARDYAVGIGTYFYKGKYGKDALKLIYDDLDGVLIDNSVYGQWAFCIHKNGATYVFNDMSGFMRLFVYENNGAIIISSSHTSILATIENPVIDKARMTGFIAGGYGREEGFVKGVAAIDPLKYVVIEDGKNPVWVNRTIPEVKRIETLDEAIEYVSSLFNEQLSVLKPAIGSKKIYIDATGGLDSRLISSNLKTSGFDFEFLNYPIFGPDAEIANLLSKGLNKKLHIQTNLPAGDDYKEHIGEYDFGNNFYRQYPNPRWELDNDFEFSGARGECIDTPDIYSDEDISYMKDPRIIALVPHLCLNSIMTEKGKNEYTEAIIDFFEERLGIRRDKKMTEYEQTKFAQFTGGQFGDSNYNSGAQAHCYFYQLYNEWHFNHFISDISFDAKSCRKLTIALIKKIDPELGSYPFVSRRRTKRNSVNEISELPMQYGGYNGVKKMLPKFVVNYLYSKMGRSFSKERLSRIDLHYYKEYLDTEELRRYPNLYSDILNRLYSLDIIRKTYCIK